MQRIEHMVRWLGISICLFALTAIFLSGCSANNLIGETFGWGDASPNPDSDYGVYLIALQDEIDSLKEATPIDKEELGQKYDILLMCRVYEYMFKAHAYGHFTGKYDTKKYDYLAKACNEVVDEMAEYFEEDSLKNLYTTDLQVAYAGFDDEYFDYEKYSEFYPDIDKMWNEYWKVTFNSVP